MKSLFGLVAFLMFVQTMVAQADTTVFCDKLLGSKARLTQTKQHIKLQSEEVHGSEAGVYKMLLELGVPKSAAKNYRDVRFNLSFPIDGCKSAEVGGFDVDCESDKAFSLKVKARIYTSSGEEFDEFEYKVRSSGLKVFRKKKEGYPEAVMTTNLTSEAGSDITIQQKFHMFPVEAGYSATCELE
jgi:hypothetical protein